MVMALAEQLWEGWGTRTSSKMFWVLFLGLVMPHGSLHAVPPDMHVDISHFCMGATLQDMAHNWTCSGEEEKQNRRLTCA